MVDYELRLNTLEQIYGSQKELADSLGVSSRAIRYWKSGETKPSQNNRNKINTRWSYYNDKKGVQIVKQLEMKNKDTGEVVQQRIGSTLTELKSIDMALTEVQEKVQEYLTDGVGYEQVDLKDMGMRVVEYSKPTQ